MIVKLLHSSESETLQQLCARPFSMLRSSVAFAAGATAGIAGAVGFVLTLVDVTFVVSIVRPIPWASLTLMLGVVLSSIALISTRPHTTRNWRRLA